jgi:hypothetical protein
MQDFKKFNNFISMHLVIVQVTPTWLSPFRSGAHAPGKQKIGPHSGLPLQALRVRSPQDILISMDGLEQWRYCTFVDNLPVSLLQACSTFA